LAKTIGQYRYKSKTDCMTMVTAGDASSDSNDMRGDVQEMASRLKSDYTDFGFEYPAGFNTSTDYYLYLRIPQDINYSCSFDIKLYNSAKNTYQFIRNITVDAGSSANTSYDVALYADSSNKIKVAMPIDIDSVSTYEKDVLYYSPSDSDTESTKYYLGDGSTTKPENEFYNYNATKLTASWLSESATTYKDISLVFRPFTTGFNQLVVEMVRTDIDSAIKRLVGSTVEQGRKVDISKVEVEFAFLTNLVNNIFNSNDENSVSGLSHIGVWGPSGLLMSVNGEEIHVGASNLYELDDILEVTSLCIVAKSYEDNFSIDYAY